MKKLLLPIFALSLLTLGKPAFAEVENFQLQLANAQATFAQEEAIAETTYRLKMVSTQNTFEQDQAKVIYFASLAKAFATYQTTQTKEAL